jgi:hypothetical protein
MEVFQAIRPRWRVLYREGLGVWETAADVYSDGSLSASLIWRFNRSSMLRRRDKSRLFSIAKTCASIDVDD